VDDIEECRRLRGSVTVLTEVLIEVTKGASAETRTAIARLLNDIHNTTNDGSAYGASVQETAKRLRGQIDQPPWTG
jgi:hypothetical protein